MSQWQDLDEFFEITPIRLPIRGKLYEFPGAVPADIGLLLHRMDTIARDVVGKAESGEEPPDMDATLLDDVDEDKLKGAIFGEHGEQQLVEAGLPQPYIDHVFKTLVVWHLYGEAVARAAWESAGPKGLAKRPQDRKAAASGTRKGSRAGTTRARKARRGPTSSATGS